MAAGVIEVLRNGVDSFRNWEEERWVTCLRYKVSGCVRATAE